MANHKYQTGDAVMVHSPRYGLKPGIIEDKFVKSGVPFYYIDIDGLGVSEVLESRIQGRVFWRKAIMEKTLSEKFSEHLKKMSDESTEGTKKEPGKEIVNEPNPELEPTVPGGAPGPLSPSEIKQDPKEKINADIVKEMGANNEKMSRLGAEIRCPGCRDNLGKIGEFFGDSQERSCPNCLLILKRQGDSVISTGKYIRHKDFY